MNKSAYREKAEAKLEKLKANIDLLQAEVSEKKADAKIDYQKLIDELNSQYKTANAKFNNLTATTQEAWEDLRDGMDKTINDLQKSVDSATNHISR